MTTNEITQTLTEVSGAVEVPTVDRVAFQRLVARERRRRTTVRVLVGAVAATALIAAGTATNLLLEPAGDGMADLPTMPSPAPRGLSETVYFVSDGQLSALDPRGDVHDLGVPSEGVVGWTAERVYALDDDSQVVEVRRVTYGDKGSRVPTFSEESGPITGPVQGAVLSGDGRYLAWLDLDDTVHRYDLAAGREDVTFPVGRNTGLASVARKGVLVSEDGALSVRDGNSTIPVPVEEDGYGIASDLAMGQVLVGDRDGQSRLYDISQGSAVLVDTFRGFGVLGPYGERVAIIVPDPADRAHLEVWDGGTRMGVIGLEDAIPQQARWADETTLLVTASVRGEPGLYSCDIELRCALLIQGDVGLNE